MKVQVLVAAMHQQDTSLIEKLNISTDAVIANQCDRDSVETFRRGENAVKYVNTQTRGVGINRNNGIKSADGDILMFADDDETFTDDYESIIKKAYSELPDADAIIFNIVTIGNDVGRRDNTTAQRLNLLNCMNYGAARLSVKRESIEKKNILFSTYFGGGTMYSAGEDTLFIVDLIKNGLKVYTYPETIATVEQTESTWFRGYNEKYFYDKGALFAAVSNVYGKLLCILTVLKNRQMFLEKLSFAEALKFINAGFKGYKNKVSYEEWSKAQK